MEKYSDGNHDSYARLPLFKYISEGCGNQKYQTEECTSYKI